MFFTSLRKHLLLIMKIITNKLEKTLKTILDDKSTQVSVD